MFLSYNCLNFVNFDPWKGEPPRSVPFFCHERQKRGSTSEELRKEWKVRRTAAGDSSRPLMCAVRIRIVFSAPQSVLKTQKSIAGPSSFLLKQIDENNTSHQGAVSLPRPTIDIIVRI